MATTIKIDGDGHTVELTGDGDVVYIVDLAKQAWKDTKSDRSAMQIGFAGQSIERSHAGSHIRGSGHYERGPVEA